MKIWLILSVLTLSLGGCFDPVSEYGRPVSLDSQSLNPDSDSDAERRRARR